jgi:hypothetical protein
MESRENGLKTKAKREIGRLRIAYLGSLYRSVASIAGFNPLRQVSSCILQDVTEDHQVRSEIDQSAVACMFLQVRVGK